jgi:putative transposase
MTTDLVKTKPGLIVIEDLSVKGMMKNHTLAKSLADASFGEIRRQLEYKAQWYGSEILAVDRFYPSSKLCSSCGQIRNELSLSERTYSCECGLELDRDLNASLNLKSYGEFHRNLSKQKACGEERSHPLAVLRTAIGGAPRGSRNKTGSLTLC